MQENNDHFYAQLPVHDQSLSQLLLQQELFHEVPPGWVVIITDIKRSTAAVSGGLHQNVNLIATGSIVSVLNIAFKENIAVPFFFGGDGATFIVPDILISKVMPGLLLYQQNTRDNFDLDLRIGIVPVLKIYEAGYQLNICKFCFSDLFPIPVVLGDGLNYAERIIKGPDYLLDGFDTMDDELNLAGMQCRWDRIPAPENKEEVVTLQVIARHPQKQHRVFSEVINYLDEIYGSPQKRQPISIAKLKLKTTFNRLGSEMKARIGKINIVELIHTWLISLYGAIYFKTKKGKRYLTQLVEMSDTLVIDGKINTVISGTLKQRSALELALNKLEAAGQIYYGIHTSNSSVMSCYVTDKEDGHIHFVDGSDGGYTFAARMLKKKLLK